MKRTLKRIAGNHRLLNRYELQPCSVVAIDLPNGDDITLYASEDGRYVSVDVKSHNHNGILKTEPTKETDYDSENNSRPFATVCESIVGKSKRKHGTVFTNVEFTAFFCDDDYHNWKRAKSENELRQCDDCGRQLDENEYNGDDPLCKGCRSISNSEESYFEDLAYGSD